MLSARVAAIPALNVTTVTGLSAPLLFNCHQATCYWIYHEMTGNPPMGWAFADSNLSNTAALLSKLAKFGQLATPANINALPDGTVLVFTDPLDVAGHSCLLDGAGQICGYNQQSWFTSLGTPNQFSTRSKAHIRWRASSHNKVLLANGSKGRLYYVDEPTAINFARHNF